MHSQYRVGAIALGGFLERCRISALRGLRITDALLAQISQRQTQRQSAVLSGWRKGSAAA